MYSAYNFSSQPTQPDPTDAGPNPAHYHSYSDSTQLMAVGINAASASKRYGMTRGELYSVVSMLILILLLSLSSLSLL